MKDVWEVKNCQVECKINGREWAGTLRRRKINSVLETKLKGEKLKGFRDRYKVFHTTKTSRRNEIGVKI